MREEFNRTADERDNAIALAEGDRKRYETDRAAWLLHGQKLEDDLRKRPWVDGDVIVQGEHESDIGVIGLTFAGIKKDLEALQNENFALGAQVARVREFADDLRSNMTGKFIAEQIDIVLKGRSDP